MCEFSRELGEIECVAVLSEQEVAASAAAEEAAEEAADANEETMQKIQAAFEDATIDLENRGDEAMDLDDFMNQ